LTSVYTCTLKTAALLREILINTHIWLLRNTVGYTYANIQNVGVSKIFVLMQSTFYLIKKQ